MDVKRKEKTKKHPYFFGAANTENEKKTLTEGCEASGNLRIWLNLGAALIGFLFGGCHLIFGSYPLGLALVSALPYSVWFALLGAVCGSLTLGRAGIIYGMICVLAVFLRVIISGGEKRDGEGARVSVLFSEGVILRVCSAVISGFVAAIYEILLEGISAQTVLFGVSMVILPGIVTLILSGAFYVNIGVRELVFGGKRIFSVSADSRDKLRLALFKASVLSFILLTSVSLEKYGIFGIDLSLIFASVITLFAAKRFGSLYGAVVGFVSSVGISGLYSVAFALLGVCAGALFVFGTWYAVAGGGLLLSAWGAYADGVSGFLTVFPEFIISLCIMMPLFRYFERESSEDVSESVKRKATDMVGTMALSYRSKKALSIETVESVVSSLVPKIDTFIENEIMTETYTIFSKLLNEAKNSVLRDREMDEALTDELEIAFAECGFTEGVIRAFGTRQKYVICSGEDKEGIKITSPLLRRSIEEASGLKFAAPEYFRRADMVLMECESTKKYQLKGAYSKSAGSSGEVSGDTADVFESKEMFAYGLISDGMGSGVEAKRTSEFVRDFLKDALNVGNLHTTVMHMLNAIVRRNKEECGATVDLFSFDEINGEATFIKSGAAPSFIKRGGSLFRIKSETMPLGFIKQVDAEKIAVNVSEDDYIIMVSDGVCQIGEDASWLIDLLNRPAPAELSEYADMILSEAKANGKGDDDMTVLVLRTERTRSA